MCKQKMVMLKALKYKFLLSIVILVEGTLIAHTCISMYLTYHAQEIKFNNYLEYIITEDNPDIEHFGQVPYHHSDIASTSNMLSMVVKLGDQGEIKPSEHPEYIGSAPIKEVCTQIMESSEERGKLTDYHVRWLKRGNTIAFVDTSAFDFSFSQSIIMVSCIMAATVVVITSIAWGLSTWAIKPVEEAMHRQRVFLGNVSHELKTPLSVIIANTDILLHSSRLEAEERKWVQNTSEEVLQLKQMINDLLELAQSDEAAAGAPNILHPARFNFSDMVYEAALEFDTLAFEHGCTIQTDIPRDFYLFGDEEKLKRLVHILLDNACKYAAKSSVIQIDLTKTNKAAGNVLQLSFTNQGEVISKEDQAHIFDRFYRSDKARCKTNKKGGFGLGLSIALGLVKSHKGTIKVESSAEKGTTFTITLPTHL